MIEHVHQPIAGLLASGILLTDILGAMVVDRMLLLRNGREIVLTIRPDRGTFSRAILRGFATTSLGSTLVSLPVSGASGANRQYM
jgi:hypothetical protein